MRILPRLLVVAAVLGIAGCTPVPASVAESASPSPIVEVTPTPEPPVAQAIVIRGGSFQLWDGEGNVLADFPYSGDGDAAVAALEAATGVAPVVTDIPSGKCNIYPTTRAVWDEEGFILTIAREGSVVETGMLFRVMARSATIGSIAVHTAEGLQVGNDVSRMFDLYPDAYGETLESNGQGGFVNYDVVAGSHDNPSEPYWGANAWGDEGIVKTLTAPVGYNADC